MEKLPSNTRERRAWFHALSLAWELGYVIAGPLVVFGIAGRWVDKHWQTNPWGLLGGVLVSILISSILIVRKIKEIIAESNE